jgi:hypothetical protein
MMASLRFLRSVLPAMGVTLSLVACSGPEPTDYRLYYLGGQSNMDGYGFNNELPEDVLAPIEDVMIFTGQAAFDNETHGGRGAWQALQPGFGTGFSSDGVSTQLSDRFGPELYFGHTLAGRAPGAKIAIVKYALGGSGLADGVGYGNWHPDFGDGGGINQYDHALTTLRNALAPADLNGDGTIDRLVPAGIVWMQGEADAHHSQAAADEYRQNLERLMNLLRAALRVDDLPVVVGKITDSGMADDGSVMDYIETVQRAQQDFVNDDACAAYVTVTDDIEHSDDAWHYDSDGYIRMGTAFAEAVKGLEETCAAPD